MRCSCFLGSRFFPFAKILQESYPINEMVFRDPKVAALSRAEALQREVEQQKQKIRELERKLRKETNGQSASSSLDLKYCIPAGGEEWKIGMTVLITWSGGDAALPVTLALVDLEKWSVELELASQITNEGEFEWQVTIGAFGFGQKRGLTNKDPDIGVGWGEVGWGGVPF